MKEDLPGHASDLPDDDLDPSTILAAWLGVKRGRLDASLVMDATAIPWEKFDAAVLLSLGVLDPAADRRAEDSGDQIYAALVLEALFVTGQLGRLQSQWEVILKKTGQAWTEILADETLSNGQREAVLSGQGSWFEPSALAATEAHVSVCPECGPRMKWGTLQSFLSTKEMCEAGRRIAIGLSAEGELGTGNLETSSS